MHNYLREIGEAKLTSLLDEGDLLIYKGNDKRNAAELLKVACGKLMISFGKKLTKIGEPTRDWEVTIKLLGAMGGVARSKPAEN